MKDEEDKELERIKKLKLKEMIKRVPHATEKHKASSIIQSKPIDLSDKTFMRFIKDNTMAVIDVWAPWCGPCRLVSPIIEEIARDYTGRIAFGKLNVDQNQRVARQYGIMGIPTLLVFKEGKLVDQIVGAMPREMLEQRIIRHL